MQNRVIYKKTLIAWKSMTSTIVWDCVCFSVSLYVRAQVLSQGKINVSLWENFLRQRLWPDFPLRCKIAERFVGWNFQLFCKRNKATNWVSLHFIYQKQLDNCMMKASASWCDRHRMGALYYKTCVLLNKTEKDIGSFNIPNSLFKKLKK